MEMLCLNECIDENCVIVGGIVCPIMWKCEVMKIVLKWWNFAKWLLNWDMNCVSLMLLLLKEYVVDESWLEYT